MQIVPLYKKNAPPCCQGGASCPAIAELVAVAPAASTRRRGSDILGVLLLVVGRGVAPVGRVGTSPAVVTTSRTGVVAVVTTITGPPADGAPSSSNGRVASVGRQFGFQAAPPFVVIKPPVLRQSASSVGEVLLHPSTPEGDVVSLLARPVCGLLLSSDADVQPLAGVLVRPGGRPAELLRPP